MPTTNPRLLLDQLNPPAARPSRRPPGCACPAPTYNVEIEHWLLKLLEPTDTDLPASCSGTTTSTRPG